MFRAVFVVYLWLLPSSALASKLVAVLEFRGAGIDNAVLMKLSDSARLAAREQLPKSEYRLMTRENMVQILRDNELDPSCVEGECEVETGRNIGADVIIAGDVLRVEGQYQMVLKLYETETGNLLGGKEITALTLVDFINQIKPATTSMLVEGMNLRKEGAFFSWFKAKEAPKTAPGTLKVDLVKAHGSLNPSIILGALSTNKARLSRCYEKELAIYPGLSGSVMAELKIQPNGKIKHIGFSPKIEHRPPDQLLIKFRDNPDHYYRWSLVQPLGSGAVEQCIRRQKKHLRVSATPDSYSRKYTVLLEFEPLFASEEVPQQ